MRVDRARAPRPRRRTLRAMRARARPRRHRADAVLAHAGVFAVWGVCPTDRCFASIDQSSPGRPDPHAIGGRIAVLDVSRTPCARVRRAHNIKRQCDAECPNAGGEILRCRCCRARGRRRRRRRRRGERLRIDGYRRGVVFVFAYIRTTSSKRRTSAVTRAFAFVQSDSHRVGLQRDALER